MKFIQTDAIPTSGEFVAIKRGNTGISCDKFRINQDARLEIYDSRCGWKIFVASKSSFRGSVFITEIEE